MSIVGCDRVPLGYYRVKTEQEGVVTGGPLPWTIVRATQFHEFVAGLLGAAARYRMVPVPREVLQPVAVAEAAAAIGRLLAGFARRPPLRVRTALVNGSPGLVMRDADGVLGVVALTIDGGRITAIDVIRDPDKLTAAAVLLG